MGKIVDLSYLEKVCEGDREFMREMIEAFIETVPESLEEAAAASTKKDWASLARLVHKMKPSISFMGIDSLKADVLELEAAAKEGKQVDVILKLLEKVRATALQAIEELKVALQAL